ncbi:MAG: ribosome biogenesis GTP-binding protein YihA/YsxC [Rickettsiales bacterium]|nr:ribosome biogenesis GTP-binding protein YihA/YsxC [Rickettsiales bacterium]
MKNINRKIRNWSNAEFKIGANSIEAIPATSLNEIAFAGRSNVGKSSLINSLTTRNSLTRVSKTPGCTKQLNFFLLEEKIYLVDMPGYGFAQISKKEQLNWGKLIKDYLCGRPYLKRVYILIDARIGFKPVDFEIMKLLDTSAVSYQIVFTKADKISKLDEEKLQKSFEAIGKKHPALHPNYIITSSVNEAGIDNLRQEIEEFI